MFKLLKAKGQGDAIATGARNCLALSDEVERLRTALPKTEQERLTARRQAMTDGGAADAKAIKAADSACESARLDLAAAEGLLEQERGALTVAIDAARKGERERLERETESLAPAREQLERQMHEATATAIALRAILAGAREVSVNLFEDFGRNAIRELPQSLISAQFDALEKDAEPIRRRDGILHDLKYSAKPPAAALAGELLETLRADPEIPAADLNALVLGGRTAGGVTLAERIGVRRSQREAAERSERLQNSESLNRKIQGNPPPRREPIATPDAIPPMPSETFTVIRTHAEIS